MSGDQQAQMVFLIAALALPLMGLAARRMPLKSTMKLIVIWLLIFAGAAAFIALVAPILDINLT